MTLSSVAQQHQGNAFTAVPSDSTGWWPCLHKPDFKSYARALLTSISSLALRAAASLSKSIEAEELLGLGPSTTGGCDESL